MHTSLKSRLKGSHPGGNLKVSILMPVFNHEQYVALAIDSVLAQTYDEIELIIIDDGSTDGTEGVISNYVKQYPEKIFYQTQVHSGASVARNKALTMVTGQLIAFLDSDDCYEPDKISKQVEFYNNHPDASFIYSGYQFIDKDSNLMKVVSPHKSMQGNIYKKLWLSNDNNIWAGTMMVSTKLINLIGGFNSNLRGAENIDLRLKLAKQGPVYFQSEILSNYRKHIGNNINNISLIESSFARLVEEHIGDRGGRNKYLWQRVMSIQEYKKGMQYFKIQDYQNARRLFLSSIRKYIFNIHSIIQLIRTLLGKNINNLIAHKK